MNFKDSRFNYDS